MGALSAGDASLVIDGGVLSGANEAVIVGDGAVLIEDAGTISTSSRATGPAVDVDATGGAVASVQVAGSGSAWNLTSSGSRFVVGDDGYGNNGLGRRERECRRQRGGDRRERRCRGQRQRRRRGSALMNSGGFVVGDAGLGSLAVLTGGSVVTSAGSASAVPGLVIAASEGASGSSVDVTGTAASLLVTGALVVGQAGLGLLTVAQGGTVSAGSIDEAAAGGDGVIVVAGTGSALSLTGSLTVGDQAAGDLSVLAGGTVTALDVTIGNASSLSSGNVDVEGNGSELMISTGGLLNIGVAGGGSRVLTVGTMATLNFNGTIVELGHASFNNNGGVVDPDAVQFTSSSNGGTGLNQYDLYVDNTGAVQVVSGTGTWDTPMMLTGTSVSDAANKIDNNGDTGQWQLSQNGTLIINANTIDAGQAIVFEDATDTLIIGQVVDGGSAGASGQTPTIAPGAENLLQAGGFSAEIWGFQTGDRTQFDNMIVTSDSIVGGNTLALFGSGNVPLGALTFFTKAGNHTSAAGAQAAAAQIVSCFAEGTRIWTARGPVAVEDLAVGDVIVTVETWADRPRLRPRVMA